MTLPTNFLTAPEAARALGVKRATLYAYVSRGLLGSSPGSDPRSRLYDRQEVEELARRRRQRRDPSGISAAALDWGLPVLDSAITLITSDGGLFYRGRDVARLARESRVEEVAALLWTGETGDSQELFSFERRSLPARWRRAMREARRGHPEMLFRSSCDWRRSMISPH